ncbi:MAG: ribonuclease Y [Puniceicoccales bacterium]|jgi:ribonuclease Y|nr:ribonuclease Y [Puniceicoccales bacterium]
MLNALSIPHNLEEFSGIFWHGLMFAAGCTVMFLLMRTRERNRREKDEQLNALREKEIALIAKEERVRMEDEYRERQEELRKVTHSVEVTCNENVRLNAELTERASKIREIEEETQAARMEIEIERQCALNETLRIAGLSQGTAREIVLENARRECETELVRMRNELLGRREEDIRCEARRVLVDTMQRLAPRVSHEACTELVSIPNEEMKGRIIGREGRNIKAFEQCTGTTLLIDETPDFVLVSSFDPVRREIASVALKNLISDGRIHPSNIENFVEDAREKVLNETMELGRNATEELCLPPLNPAIAELLGRLHFRLSNNQNTLSHSIEVARLAGLIAAELGLDPTPAKRAGLLHDIGKTDAEHEDSHAKIGAGLLRQHDEDPRVVNAVAAHHGEVEPTSIYAPIIVIADTLSAARPGARASSLDGFIERMKNIENIAKAFPGITEAYALMAGREVRVIVSPDVLNESKTRETALKIRARIENELQYSGTIHVILIREQRFHEEAR